MPDDPRANNLIALRQMIDAGDLVEASTLLRRRIEDEPDNAEAWFLMARVAKLAGRSDTALEMVETALTRQPATPEYLNEKGQLLTQLGEVEKACACYREILQLDANHFESHAALGRYHAAKRQLQSAYRHLRSAAQLRPDVAEIYNLLGQVLLDAGVLEDARNAFLACLEIEPGHVQALLRLGNLHRERSQTGQAIQYYQRALAVKPNDPYVLSNLGNAWLDLGEPAEAIHCYERSLQQHPDAPTTHGNLVFALNYQPGLSPVQIAEAHREWGARHAAGLQRVGPAAGQDFSAGHPLRIGLVSADFRQHPVGAFAEILFRHLPPDHFTMHAYDSGTRADSTTARLQSLVPKWRQIGQLRDDDAARLIQEDKIDVLLDLSGHTSGGRLLLFARHPATLQVALFAYPNTTGLEAMDYRITDALADPPGTTEHLHTEKLVRLAKTAWVYAPPDCASETRPAPVLAGHPFTFGCLNNPAKISRAAIQLWGEILRQRPEARLMLLVREEPEHAQRLRQKFSETGARAGQLWLVPRAPLAGYLEYHHAVDLMLDPFPYNGGVTTCDALWMGVPVLALAGDTYVSRQGVSLLGNAGLPEFVAVTPAELAQKAIAWAKAPRPIAELRANLREKLRRSPLLDHAGYGAELGQTLRRLWNECRTPAQAC